MKILTLNKPHITDFAYERNKLLEKVKDGEWILFLDSDEKIFNLKFEISNEFESYKLTRKNYFLRQFVGRDKIIRLVRKGTGKWQRAVHETWKANNPNSVGMIQDSYIIHNTANDLNGYLKKINNYSTLHAKENAKVGKKSNIIKIIFFPIAKFILTIIKSRNVVFSIMQSLHSFISWSKLYLHQF